MIETFTTMDKPVNLVLVCVALGVTIFSSLFALSVLFSQFHGIRPSNHSYEDADGSGTSVPSSDQIWKIAILFLSVSGLGVSIAIFVFQPTGKLSDGWELTTGLFVIVWVRLFVFNLLHRN